MKGSHTMSGGLLTVILMTVLFGCTKLQPNADNAAPSIQNAGQSDKPNVIFILIDDLGYADFSITGNTKVETPNIDRLAKEGVLIERFYVNAPICSATRAALLTGQYQHRHSITSFLHTRASNAEREQANWLDPEAPTLGKLFRSSGYRTAHIGKWHLGGGREIGDAPLITEYGFDRSFTSFEGLGDRYLITGHPLSEQSGKLGRGEIMWGPKHKMTETYVDRAIDFIDDASGERFFIQLWLDDVHDWHMPSIKRKTEMTNKGFRDYERDFLAVLVEMDAQLGRLFDYLEDQGLDGNTLIVITGDNGPSAWPRYYVEPESEAPGDTGGLRGRKWSLYEGGIRQPLIVRWPDGSRAGVVDATSVVAGVDFYPTFAALLEAGGAADSDGVSVLDAIRGARIEGRPALFWSYALEGNRSAYAYPYLARDKSPPLAMRDGEWKLLVDSHGKGAELYNLAVDPFETTNVAADHPARVSEMSDAIQNWYESVAVSAKESSYAE